MIYLTSIQVGVFVQRNEDWGGRPCDDICSIVFVQAICSRKDTRTIRRIVESICGAWMGANVTLFVLWSMGPLERLTLKNKPRVSFYIPMHTPIHMCVFMHTHIWVFYVELCCSYAQLYFIIMFIGMLPSLHQRCEYSTNP